MSRIDDLIKLEAIARERLGLVFPGTRLATFHRGVERAADEVLAADEENENDEELLHRFVLLLERDDPKAHEVLAREITIGETYFFRDEKHFDVVRDLARRAFSTGDSLTLWSAGSSSGEEAYSLAIVALEAVPEIASRLQVIGTDISARVIERARRATYRTWSFRGVSPLLIQGWFESAAPLPGDGDGDRDGGGPGAALLSPIARVRECVRFERANLLTPGPSVPSNVDVTFCRNVLIYFDPPSIDKATHVLASSLRRDGVLVTGPSDPLLSSSKLVVDRERGFITYIKEPRETAASTTRGQAPPPPPSRPARATQRTRAFTTSRPPPASFSGATSSPSAPPPRLSANAPPLDAAFESIEQAKDLAARGEFERARSILEALPPSARSQPALILLSIVRSALGDKASSIQSAKEAVAKGPDCAESLTVLALALHAAGDLMSAREAIASAQACLDVMSPSKKLVAHRSPAALGSIIHGLSTQIARPASMLRRRRPIP